jgi:hypothetical protein
VHLVITCVDSGAYESVTSANGVKISVVASPVLTPEQQATVDRTAYTIRNPMTQMATILRLCLDPVEDAMFDAARRLGIAGRPARRRNVTARALASRRRRRARHAGVRAPAGHGSVIVTLADRGGSLTRSL